MYFNEGNKETNVDKEFSNKKSSFLDFGNLDLKKIIIIAVVFIVLIIILILLFSKKTEYYLTLKGDSDIVLNEGTEYIEYGYDATDSKGKTYDDSEVTREGEVNTDIAGEYVLTYTFKEIQVQRHVTVVATESNNTILGINGDNIIFLPLGESYEEPGYYAIDSNHTSEEMHDKIQVLGEVNTSVAGTYRIKYTLVTDDNVTLIKERLVVVTSAEFTLYYEPNEPTNKAVKIYGFMNNNYFDYIKLPDGKTEKNRNFSYVVSENKTYEFEAFLKDGSSHKESIEIKNIDLVKPTGNCNAVVDGNTVVTVNAEDENGIFGYQYNLDGYKTDYLAKETYTYNKRVQKVYVDVQDKAGNVYNMMCNIKTIIGPSTEQQSQPSEPSSVTPSPSSSSSSSKKPASSSSSAQTCDLGTVDSSAVSAKKSWCSKFRNNVTSDYNLVTSNVITFADAVINTGTFQDYPPKYSDLCMQFAFYHAYTLYSQGDFNGMRAKYACGSASNCSCGVYYGGKFTTISNENKQTILDKVLENLKAGKPVLLHVSGSAQRNSRHYVTVVGYKKNLSGSKISDSDLVYIDPYDGCLERMDETTNRFMITGHQAGYNYGYQIMVLK